MAFQRPIFDSQVRQRNYNSQAHIEGPLAHLNDRELQKDVKEFSKYLPGVEYETVLRAARVAQNSLTYDHVARNNATQTNLLVRLAEDEKEGLRAEQDDLRGQFRHILPVVLTVGCAAFLQGHVQASINSSSLYAALVFGAPESGWQWELGAMNAIPFFIAALVGAPSALLFNYWMGRRGAITIAAFMIFASSLGSAWTTTWLQLLCVRIIGGVGEFHFGNWKIVSATF
ncbi:hypothetical protein N0V82_005195 [Gnomoniopsis sp. IMI 355080]|nr:hypothetical protein N0V82_005195 [Gnomoniopsis sp. IMI 355080]